MHLFSVSNSAVEELQKSRLNLEKVQKIVNFQMDLPYDQRRALIISDEVAICAQPDHILQLPSFNNDVPAFASCSQDQKKGCL